MRVRRAVFLRVFAGLLLAQGVLGITTWLLLGWGTGIWLRHQGRHLVKSAETVAAGFTASDVSAVAAGDTTSPLFSTTLARLEKLQRESLPPLGATAALFAVETGSGGPRLSIRVASYPPYQPDDRMAPGPPGQVDRGCIDTVLAGVSSMSPQPYGGGEPGEATVISGYAPIRDSDGSVRAVVAFDWSVLPAQTLRDAVRRAFLVAASAATALLPVLAWVLAGRLLGAQESSAGAVPGGAAESDGVVGPPVALPPSLAPSQESNPPPPPLLPPLQGAGQAPPTPVRTPFLAIIDERWSALSEREVELVKHVGQALSTRDIAERMCVQESTVKQHLKNVYRELGIHSREELVVISVYKFGFRLEGPSASSDEV